MNFSVSSPTIAFFSHPNHEIAILSLLRKTKSRLVFLTDGGGEARIKESKRALSSAGLLGNTVFLPNSEQSFYEALLHLDTTFFSRVASDVRGILRDMKPEQILCDAVEFYNPIHDMTLAIVALADDACYEGVFEVPLLYQKPGHIESYGVQTVLDARIDRIEIPLTQEETQFKVNSLLTHYRTLYASLGTLLLSAPEALRKETLLPATPPLRYPEAGRILRYEHRAAALLKNGKISSEITHAYHYLPLVADLLGSAHR